MISQLKSTGAFIKTLLLMIGLCLSISSVAKTQTILVTGDSLSAGYGINIDKAWVTLLQQAYAKEASIKVINASVSGETTSGGLNRLPALLSSHKPTIVVIELGANDGLRGQPLKLMNENLHRMISLSQAAQAKVLLVGMQIPTNYGRRYTQEFKDSFPTLAEKNKIPLVPFMLEGVALHPELIQSDGLHPTAAAQPIILNNVKPLVDQLLSELSQQ